MTHSDTLKRRSSGTQNGAAQMVRDASGAHNVQVAKMREQAPQAAALLRLVCLFFVSICLSANLTKTPTTESK